MGLFSFKRGRELGRAKIRHGNLLKMDLSQVDIAFIYGHPSTLQSKLKPKLENELKPGAKLISYEFPISGWEAAEIDKGQTRNDTRFFAYRF